MNSRYLKQVGYNDRITDAEKEVAAINCDVAEFLDDMTLNPEEQVIICINGSEEMKREKAQVGGQLWMRGEGRMTASNQVREGLANTRESAILSAAVKWTHTLEKDVEGPRKGLRVVIYPQEMTKLEQVLETRDLSIDPEDGHELAYGAIIQGSQNFEIPPVFLTEDSPVITGTHKCHGWYQDG
jgi:hypothetical protein